MYAMTGSIIMKKEKKTPIKPHTQKQKQKQKTDFSLILFLIESGPDDRYFRKY